MKASIDVSGFELIDPIKGILGLNSFLRNLRLEHDQKTRSLRWVPLPDTELWLLPNEGARLVAKPTPIASNVEVPSFIKPIVVTPEDPFSIATVRFESNVRNELDMRAHTRLTRPEDSPIELTFALSLTETLGQYTLSSSDAQ